ncbi:ParA family protein [Bradyrhizobium ontarionense]|uniref:ParA family protein n=1 Tax=Bradyrhizobium ontarionense TaxID=2898149 RepID=A0ABY3R586_9BRAD|nr:ParA family protein [Bradyrhizobium sp. A19]UFZ02222.1 ParA family protein [Bradyrhizobium sp. A19]
MYTIVLATQKGGSGKSTLAIGLAVAAQQAGHKVRVIETDRQGTLSKWQARRNAGEPIVEAVYDAKMIEPRLEAASHEGVTLCVIDTGSGITASTTAAIRHCDLCLIPARPSVADIEATAPTLSIVRAWRKPFAFVLNQAPIRGGHRVTDATTALDSDAPRDIAEVLAQPFIMMRNDHQDALAAGLGVSEFDTDGKSAQEIRSLWRWTAGKLAGDHVMHEAGELKEASEHAEVEFPIMLAPPSDEAKVPATRAYPTWADNGINWKAGL